MPIRNDVKFKVCLSGVKLKIAINDHQPQRLDGFKFAVAVLKRSLLSPGPSYPDTVEGN